MTSLNVFFTTNQLILYTLLLGKWTTYRSMAQDTVDKVVEVGGLNDPPSLCHHSTQVRQRAEYEGTQR